LENKISPEEFVHSTFQALILAMSNGVDVMPQYISEDIADRSFGTLNVNTCGVSQRERKIEIFINKFIGNFTNFLLSPIMKYVPVRSELSSLDRQRKYVFSPPRRYSPIVLKSESSMWTMETYFTVQLPPFLWRNGVQ
jgi:hypothetical protein